MHHHRNVHKPGRPRSVSPRRADRVRQVLYGKVDISGWRIALDS